MTRKPAAAKSAAATASTRTKAVAAPARAARTTPTSAAAPGGATKTTRSAPVKTAAAKAGTRVAAKPVAPKAAGKVAATAAVKAPAKSAAKAPAKASVKASVKAPVKATAKAAPKAAAKGGAPAVKPPTRGLVVKQPALGLRNAAKALVKAGKESPASGRASTTEAPQDNARPTLVRDSFTMPGGEYAVLADVKQACLKAGFEIKKSELLRIGVALVGRLDIATLRQVLDGLPQLKTGRPPSQ